MSDPVMLQIERMCRPLCERVREWPLPALRRSYNWYEREMRRVHSHDKKDVDRLEHEFYLVRAELENRLAWKLAAPRPFGVTGLV